MKMWQLTGKDLWTMEVFPAVTNKDEMNKKDLSLMTYWRSFWKDPEDSPKQPKQNISNIAHHQILARKY